MFIDQPAILWCPHQGEAMWTASEHCTGNGWPSLKGSPRWLKQKQHHQCWDLGWVACAPTAAVDWRAAFTATLCQIFITTLALWKVVATSSQGLRSYEHIASLIGFEYLPRPTKPLWSARFDFFYCPIIIFLATFLADFALIYVLYLCYPIIFIIFFVIYCQCNSSYLPLLMNVNPFQCWHLHLFHRNYQLWNLHNAVRCRCRTMQISVLLYQ